MTGRVRTFCYTVQNLTDLDYIAVENYDVEKIDWVVVAEEVGEKEEKRHFQAAIRFKHGKTWKAAFKWLGLKGGDNLETMRSAEFSASAYCLKGVQSKEEWNTDGVDGETYGMRVNVVRQEGLLPVRGDGEKISVWDSIIQSIKMGWTDAEIIDKWPAQAFRCQSAIAKYRIMHDRKNAAWRDVETVYIQGDTGAGKTRWVMETHGYSNVYRVTDYGTGAFDNYDGQDVVVFEEFRSSFKVQDMLNYLDGYPVELPARYANKLAHFTKVYIITNWDFHRQYDMVKQNYEKTWAAWERRIDGLGEIFEGKMQIVWKDATTTEHELPWVESSELTTE